ncbi:MAG TPA: hypothetical protein VHU84_05980 [Lacipirellulaceae bacterium]|jgi:hypothetical protein|nr:hypothetical protein [Lacipirellulaceae bacterium]
MKYSPIFLKICRPLYRLGGLILLIGTLAIVGGLVLGVLGNGWMSLLIGIGLCLVGIVVGRIPEVYVANQLKFVYHPLSAKQAYDLVAKHLRAKGADAEDTRVFLGRIVGELEYEQRQREKQCK